MRDTNYSDDGEEKAFKDEPFINKMPPSSKKKRKIIIIVGVSVVVVAIIVAIVLVILLKNNNKDEKGEVDPPENIYEMIKLEVYSDSDEKEILFLSDDFNINNLEGRQVMDVDGKIYPFTKSMKLSKGDHIVKLYLNETKNSCENMFKNCKDIKSIYFNNSYDCQDNMDNMFSGCSSLLSVNFDTIKTSYVKTMKNLFESCGNLENIDFNNLVTNNAVNMEKMFSDCKSFIVLNLDKLNTSSVF